MHIIRAMHMSMMGISHCRAVKRVNTTCYTRVANDSPVSVPAENALSNVFLI
jgi:hypothetical protein